MPQRLLLLLLPLAGAVVLLQVVGTMVADQIPLLLGCWPPLLLPLQRLAC
jgi:hypothetical protein